VRWHCAVCFHQIEAFEPEGGVHGVVAGGLGAGDGGEEDIAGLLGVERIPDPFEAEVSEVLFIYRGKFGDSLMEKGEGNAPIEGAAACERIFAEPGPEGIMEGTAIRREADQLPAGVIPKGFADLGSSVGLEWLGEHRRVSQQGVQLQEDEFTHGDIIPGLKGTEKGRSAFMVRIVDLHRGQENVGVERDHGCGRLRSASSDEVASRSLVRGILMPPPSTRGRDHFSVGIGQSG